MRVVAGRAKGRRLEAPPGRATRPTSDRVREAIFSMLASLGGVTGATVADLFAGSGALGIEALSRGAASVTFVDRDRRAAGTVRANLEAIAPGPGEVVTADVLRWILSAPAFDIVLADPPYGYDHWPELLERLRGMTGLVVIESDRPVDAGDGWRLLKQKHYGGTVVTIIESAAQTSVAPSGADNPGHDSGPDPKGGM